jgi:hypothetical protein
MDSQRDGSGLEAVTTVSTSLHKKLVENSIAVTSVSQPGVIFAMNDSRNEALLFAIDSTGRGTRVWQVTGALNRDWEAAALGPCRPDDGVPSCLYIGDVGDNESRRNHVSIYRVQEPVVTDSSASIQPLDRLDFRYADHAHDVEAMYVAPDGAILLITKRRLLGAGRRPRPALIFRLSPESWDSSGVATASLVDSLPIVPGEAPGRLVTDAALSHDGKRLAVRTYSEVFTFDIDSGSGLPAKGHAFASCVILGLDRRQGEGVGWWWDGRRLVLTSEGQESPLQVIRCALPPSS